MTQSVTSTVWVLVETMKREGRMKGKESMECDKLVDDLGAKPLVGIFCLFY